MEPRPSARQHRGGDGDERLRPDRAPPIRSEENQPHQHFEHGDLPLSTFGIAMGTAVREPTPAPTRAALARGCGRRRPPGTLRSPPPPRASPACALPPTPPPGATRAA